MEWEKGVSFLAEATSKVSSSGTLWTEAPGGDDQQNTLDLGNKDEEIQRKGKLVKRMKRRAKEI